MTLQSLFTEPIVEQRALDPGNSGHASDVWLVRTRTEEVIVRASRLDGQPDNEFWWGLHHLFGVDPRRVFDLEQVNACLSRLSSIPVPRVLRRGYVEERPHVVVERMAGNVLRSFAGLSGSALRELGGALARIHSHRFDWCGSPAGTLQYAPAQFPTHLVATMEELVARFYGGVKEMAEPLRPMCEAARRLPAPEAGALIMADMDPSQFLWDGERLTALVDTEAYGVGPRELDFIALEYVLDARGAAAVADGYRTVLPLPDLSAVRPVYRYLYRLLRIQGSVPLGEWLAWPHLF